MKLNDKGSIVVEATLSLSIFLIALATMISLINIMTLHSRVQYAISQSVKEISSYSYLYAATGLKSAKDDFDDTVSEKTENIDKIAGDLSALLGGISSTQDAAKNVDYEAMMEEIKNTVQSGEDFVGSAIDIAKNPESLLFGMLYLSADKALDATMRFVFANLMAKPFTEKYLDVGTVDDGIKVSGKEINADSFLKSYGVVEGMGGLDFSRSSLFLDGKTIDIVVEYYIKPAFWIFPTQGKGIRVVQRAAVAGWLDGDGVQYED